MAGYVKLFGSILDSTVWDTPPPIKVVWITMLAMADRDGIVEASVPGLAKRAGVERGECERALALFSAPDPDSRSRDFEGRRIEAIDGGWRLLNYDKYRERASADAAREQSAARQQRFRDRRKAAGNAPATPETRSNAPATRYNESNPIAEAEAEADPSPPASPPARNDARAREAPAPDPAAARDRKSGLLAPTRIPLDALWHAATGIQTPDLAGLIELRAHVDAVAATHDRDPDALLTDALRAFRAYRETCTNGRIPALAPRKVLDHWSTVWELVEGKRPKGRPPEGSGKGKRGSDYVHAVEPLPAHKYQEGDQ